MYDLISQLSVTPCITAERHERLQSVHAIQHACGSPLYDGERELYGNLWRPFRNSFVRVAKFSLVESVCVCVSCGDFIPRGFWARYDFCHFIDTKEYHIHLAFLVSAMLCSLLYENGIIRVIYDLRCIMSRLSRFDQGWGVCILNFTLMCSRELENSFINLFSI